MQNEREGVSILKSTWTKTPSDKWEMSDIHSIDLKPRKGSPENYYKVENEFKLLTSAPGNTISGEFFTAFGTTNFLVGQSIVPVVAWNDGDKELRCLGTAFFISASGYLLTAAHVLRDPMDERYGHFTPIHKQAVRIDPSFRIGVLIQNNPAARGAPFEMPAAMREAVYFVHPIEWACHWGQDQESPLLHEEPQFRYDIDVAVLKVREHSFGGAFQPLNIGSHGLSLGDRAVAIGYPEMKNIPVNPGGKVYEYLPEIVVSVGKVSTIYADNVGTSQSTTPGPCFDFTAKIPGKMSGGPILVGSGIVTKGVVSRSWQGEDFATGCLIAPMLNRQLGDRGSLMNLMMSGSDGIARIVGSDL